MNPSPRTRRGHDLPVATVTRLTPADPGRHLRSTEEPPAVQGTLALELRGSEPGPPTTPELDDSYQARVGHVDDGEVRGWAARFAQAVVEAVGGQRPASQLVRWTSPEVFRDLDRRARLVRRAADPSGRPVRSQTRPPIRPQVRSVHVCRPSPDVAEVSVHVRHGHRSRALALRLERSRGRWLCTVLEFG